jgi:hypothetical protein
MLLHVLFTFPLVEISLYLFLFGMEAVVKFVEALCYKPEGLESETRRVIEFFPRHYCPGVDSASTEMSTKDPPGGLGRPARNADRISAICELIAYNDVGTSTSHKPMGLHGLLQG